MTNKLKAQIMAVRNIGIFNMFQVNDIQRFAKEHGMKELAEYIEKEPEKYTNFIMTGKE